MICFIVWDEWSRARESFMSHLNNISPYRPCSIRILFKITHTRRFRVKPGTWKHGSSINWCQSWFNSLQFANFSAHPTGCQWNTWQCNRLTFSAWISIYDISCTNYFEQRGNGSFNRRSFFPSTLLAELGLNFCFFFVICEGIGAGD